MNLPRTNLNLLAQMGLVALLAGSLGGEAANALGPQPDTPCPCVAEGTCKPQGPWGYTQTQWRRWPGDTIERPEDVQAEEEDIRGTLPGSELPLPEKEGLRGPEPQEDRRKKKKRREGLAGEIPAEVEPGEGVPAPFPAVEPPPELPPDLGPGLPDDVGPLQPEPAAEQPLEQPEAEEESADDFFDPFSQIESSLEETAEPATSTTQAPKLRQSNGPPPLPSSLKKFSRALRPKTPSYARSKRSDQFQAVALAR